MLSGKQLAVGAVGLGGLLFLAFGRTAKAAEPSPGPDPGPKPDPGTGAGPSSTSACMTSDVAAVETVGQIQKSLITLGFSVGSSGADGKCGPGTHGGISAFQSSKGISATGVVDNVTLVALKDALAKKGGAVDSTADSNAGYSAGSEDAASTIATIRATCFVTTAGCAGPAQNPQYDSSKSSSWQISYRDGFSTTIYSNGWLMYEGADSGTTWVQGPPTGAGDSTTSVLGDSL